MGVDAERRCCVVAFFHTLQVFTDVADSTLLWEWHPDVMDRAIELHNTAIRSMLDEFGGHEIRNEGDSFTLSFHDAVDAVKFCLKV